MSDLPKGAARYTPESTGFLVAHAHRTVRDEKGQNRIATLDALPDPTDIKSGGVSLFSRIYRMAGMAGEVYDNSSAAVFPSRTAARRWAGSRRLVITCDEWREWSRVRHLTRARAKARKAGR